MTAWHWAFDGIADKPQCPVSIASFIDRLVELTGLTKIADLGVEATPDGGMAGGVIIAESHITIHLKPDGHGFIDMFSCVRFDVPAAYALVHEAMGGWWESRRLR